MVVKALAIFIWTFVLHFSLKQGCYRAGKPGKPEKIRELKICSKSQGKDREFIKKMVKSGKCQGISKLELVKHVIAYLFMVNWFFVFKLITN